MKDKFIWFDDRLVLDYEEYNDSIPSISIACAPTCDFTCPHCIYNTPFNKNAEGMTEEEKITLVREAAKLGCHFLQICHEGEPFLDPTTMPVLREAHKQGMRSFMFTHGAYITPEIAQELYEMQVCLGVKCDSLDEHVFNRMIGVPRSKDIYQGIRNLLDVGYNIPFERDGKKYTRLSLVCTVTEINLHTVKDVAKYCWDNKIFFNIARLEKGGRANIIWEQFRVKDPEKLREVMNWCSEQTGIDYRFAQPDCYCIGVCGVQINHNGDVWITKEGCGCDLTEPDGITYPETEIIGNVCINGLEEVVSRVWEYRMTINGGLDSRMKEYVDNLKSDSIILAACGGSRTHHLFRAYQKYVKKTLSHNEVSV